MCTGQNGQCGVVLWPSPSLSYAACAPIQETPLHGIRVRSLQNHARVGMSLGGSEAVHTSRLYLTTTRLD
eukprot:3975-Eustigmatos_ZCMA.PRE.1